MPMTIPDCIDTVLAHKPAKCITRAEAAALIGHVMQANGGFAEDAVAYITDPANQVACETCGWTNGMLCPECPGCGCYNSSCSGWRHREDPMDYEDREPEPCFNCGEPGCPGYCNVEDYNMPGRAGLNEDGALILPADDL